LDEKSAKKHYDARRFQSRISEGMIPDLPSKRATGHPGALKSLDFAEDWLFDG
jgi:hypothetical protein